MRACVARAPLTYKPHDIVDGDEAYWEGGMYALLGDRD